MKTTLLITTFNRGHLLKNSLERLCLLTIPDEIIIVDDGGSDNTEGVCKDFEGRLPIKYIYNHNPNWSICSMARNIGVKQATGDIIITSEPELLWISDIVKQMLEDRLVHPNEVISAGVIYHAQGSTPWHPALTTNPKEALKDSIVEDYEIQPRSYRQDGFVRTFNHQATFTALYEKKWLMDLGGWDEAFPGAWGFDDIELCTRLRINGINQHICPDMEVIHQWHPHLPPHIQGPQAAANDEYFKSKRLDLVEQDILEQKRLGTYKGPDERLIANKGKDWGVIIPK
jgi:glycosyltransferase involved in cell wall biosynthesis